MCEVGEAFDAVKKAGFKLVMLTDRGTDEKPSHLCTLARSHLSPMNTWHTGRGTTVASAVKAALALAKPRPPKRPTAPDTFEELLG